MRHLAGEGIGRSPVASSEGFDLVVGSRPWLVVWDVASLGPPIARREKSCHQHTHACPSVVVVAALGVPIRRLLLPFTVWLDPALGRSNQDIGHSTLRTHTT